MLIGQPALQRRSWLVNRFFRALNEPSLYSSCILNYRQISICFVNLPSLPLLRCLPGMLRVWIRQQWAERWSAHVLTNCSLPIANYGLGNVDKAVDKQLRHQVRLLRWHMSRALVLTLVTVSNMRPPNDRSRPHTSTSVGSCQQIYTTLDEQV